MSPNPITVLVVDDEPQMVEIVKFALETQGFQTVTAGSAEEGWKIVESTHLDLLVLDVMLPGRSGLTLCRRVREHSDTPVLLLTARGEAPDRLAGFEAGADDYVVKPFNPRELALRAQAIVRRSRTGKSSQLIRNGPLVIDVSSGKVTLNSTAIKLTDIELRLLIALGRKIDQTVNWRDLLTQVWETESQLGGKEMLKTAVYRLRSRLGDSGDQIIASVRGVGYTMTKVESLPGELS